MPDIKFYLQKPREASSLILVAYTPAPNRRYRISTGQRAETAQWNKKAQRCRGSARFQGNAALNALLDRIQDALNALDSESRLAGHGAPTKEQAVGAVRRATGRESAELAGQTLMGFFRGQVAAKERQPGTWSPGRIRQYRALLRHLETFQDLHYPLSWNNLNARFRDDFTEYSFSDCSHANNTLVKHVNLMKALLSDAVQHGHISQEKREAFARLWRQAKEDVPQLTYLTREELEAVRALETDPGGMSLARDLAIAQAFTGLRFSDLVRLTEKAFSVEMDPQAGEEIEVFQLSQAKTKTLVKVPLHPYVREVAERHGGKMPRLSHQKFNAYLKEVCKLAGVAAPVTIVRNRAGRQRAEGCGFSSNRRSRILNVLLPFNPFSPPVALRRVSSPVSTLHPSTLIPPVPHFRTLAAIVFSPRGFLARTMHSMPGLSALPQPAHCWASGVAGAVTVLSSMPLAPRL